MSWWTQTKNGRLVRNTYQKETDKKEGVDKVETTYSAEREVVRGSVVKEVLREELVGVPLHP